MLLGMEFKDAYAYYKLFNTSIPKVQRFDCDTLELLTEDEVEKRLDTPGLWKYKDD